MIPLGQLEAMTYRVSVSLMRMILGISIFFGVFGDQGFYYELCGDLAIPPNPKFMAHIIIIEFVASQYPLLLRIACKASPNNFLIQSLGQNYTVKNLIVLLLKLGVIFGQAHRLKFYIHALVIESTILISSFLFDFTGNQNVYHRFM